MTLWQKIKAALKKAALWIVGLGAAVGIALSTGLQEEGVDAEQWCAKVEAIRDIQAQKTGFIAIPQDVIADGLPKAHGDYVMGNCGDLTCDITPSDAPHCGYEYRYKASPIVNGYRLFEVTAHPEMLKGWRGWAQSFAGESFGDRVYWWASFNGPLKACINAPQMSNSQCLNILELDSRCLILPDGRYCRHGQLLGEDASCPYAAILADPDNAVLYPCTVYRGAGSELVDAFADLDAELDGL